MKKLKIFYSDASGLAAQCVLSDPKLEIKRSQWVLTGFQRIRGKDVRRTFEVECIIQLGKGK